MTRRLTALITGASAGLGAEFARQLAASGCSLILVARRVERLQAIARQLQGEFGGVEVLCIEADLSRVDAPEQIRDQVSVHGWQVDYLINNAGASGPDFSEPSHGLSISTILGSCRLVLPSYVTASFLQC